MPHADLLAGLLSDLDVAVLERAPDATYTLITPPPAWLRALWPEATCGRTGLRPGDRFLFLDDFLGRADAFWTGAPGRALASPAWTERAPDGAEWLLEAVARTDAQRPTLLLRVPPLAAARPAFQQAREEHLRFSRLVEEVNKREVLLHCIVHDLSNPLAGIKGTLKLLEADALVADGGNELLRIGLNQLEKMQRLVGEILETFSADVEPLLPTLVRADDAPDAERCAREVCAAMSPAAGLQTVRLSVVVESGSSWKVVGERGRLERVLFNLLANALRHSPAGSTITVRLRDADEAVRLEVDDQGDGVPASYVDALFHKFSQGPGPKGQAGLGLYSCRITVESWGGAIGYAPNPAGGARFWIRLPRPLS